MIAFAMSPLMMVPTIGYIISLRTGSREPYLYWNLLNLLVQTGKLTSIGISCQLLCLLVDPSSWWSPYITILNIPHSLCDLIYVHLSSLMPSFCKADFQG
jgi:hypothetical protein